MKTQMLIAQACLLTAMSVFGIACAKKGNDGGSPAGGPVTSSVTTTTIAGGPSDTDAARGTEWTEGATTSLTIDSISTLNNYVATHPVNNPTDIRISVKTYDVGSNRYAGKVMISYYDNGTYYTGKFETTNETVAKGYSHGHEGKNYAEYNKWFTWNGKSVFHGFFQDQIGAVVLVADDYLDLGDGSGVTAYGGEIWYKNFAVARSTQGYIPCWFIEIGPYDCRTFLADSEILNTTSALYPSQSTYMAARGWQRLGRYGNLNATRAFGSN